MSLAKQTKPEGAKRYFLKKGEAEVTAATPLTEMRHKKCGGAPILQTTPATTNYKAKSIAQCSKCHHELFLGTSHLKNVGRYQTQYYTAIKVEIFLDKMEPVFRSVEKDDGHVAYSSWEKLSAIDLIKFYHKGKDVEVIVDSSSPLVV